MQKRFDSNPEIFIFSAFRSKNTPTVPHQTIQLLCEKNLKIQKIVIFLSQPEGTAAFLITNKNTENMKSYC